MIGIVAARLKERYERPACVVALADGIGKGSGRSVPGVALGPAVIAARQAGLLLNGGGHAMAAGFTVAADRLDELREFLAERLGDGLDRAAAGARTGDRRGAVRRGGAGRADRPSRRAGAVRRRQSRSRALPFPSIRVAHAEPVGTGHLR